ncbi:MAG: nickel pincer cofactor biosynthesis protein LarB [Candidatus Omnitrophota bacterium]|nr:nickel pincer cofactor biosynthesis protein LarB [Candidatus Omnitrophota bacterium]
MDSNDAMINKKGFCDLGFAKIDTDRHKRRGFAEAVYCPGKTKTHLKKISIEFLKNKQDLLLTKLDKPVFAYLKRFFPGLKYNPLAKIGYIQQTALRKKKDLVLVISAGTTDIPIAEEAAATLEIMGNKVKRIYDAGVAGVHRIMNYIDIIKKSKIIIVVAGMEGALASLVSGITSSAIIAVPTSCGYGANFQGLSSLLTMLNSCSPGVVTVNIDNGFGAGYFANLINR